MWSGSLEVLDRLGIAERIREQATPIHTGRYLSDERQITSLRLNVPGTRWHTPLSIPQPIVERVLRNQLAKLGVDVEWDRRVLGAHTQGDQAIVEVEARDGPEPERLQASYVIAADGSRSAIRTGLGIGRSGRTFPRDFLLMDGEISFPRNEPGKAYANYYLTERGIVVIVPLAGGGHRIFLDLPANPGAPREPEQVMRDIATEMRNRFREPPTMPSPQWASRFRIHAKVADTFVRGRILLAGDAAHVHSPAGGQGMNTGIQDGWDLGWRIPALLRGADPVLLQGYSIERRLAAVRAVRQAELQTRMWLLRGPLRYMRNFVMERALRASAARRTAIDRLAQIRWPITKSPATVQHGRIRTFRIGERVTHLAQSTGHTFLLLGGGSASAEAKRELALRLPHCDVREQGGTGQELSLVWVRPDAMVGGHVPWAERERVLRLLGAEL